MVEDTQKDVNELVEQLYSLYLLKVKEYVTYIGNKHKVHLVYDDNDGRYFHCEIKYNGKKIKLVLGYESGDYCEINSQNKLPELIKNDFEIAEELNDKNNDNYAIWKYDSHKESLLRFERVLERLLDIINEC